MEFDDSNGCLREIMADYNKFQVILK